MVLYLGNPCTPRVVGAMIAGDLGFLDTPRQRNVTAAAELHAAGVPWGADNGAYSDRFELEAWRRFVEDRAEHAPTALFAVAPDVVADAAATLDRSLPWLPWLRELGYPAALVAQDGQESLPVPWDELDVLFLGGSTGWKLGPHARRLTAEATRRGKRVHMGRVNSHRRYRYGHTIGCHTADGTILTRGPDVNLRRVLTWRRELDQLELPLEVAP